MSSHNTAKKEDKRQKLLSKRNSKIVCLNSKEGEMFFELLTKVDDMFKGVRLRAGAVDGFSVEDAERIIKSFHKTLLKTSDILGIIGENAEIPYREPLLIEMVRREAEREE